MSMHLKRLLSLGIAQNPLEYYMFHALIKGVLDVEPYGLSLELLERDQLDQLMESRTQDLGRVHVAMLPDIQDAYVILRSGCTVARGYGPAVFTKAANELGDISDMLVAMPSGNTLAGCLAGLHGLGQARIVEMEQVMIERAVLSGRVDAGVADVGRLAGLPERGLRQLLDLGAWWEQMTGLPLCQEVMVAKRSLGMDTIRLVEEAIRRSIRWAQDNHAEVLNAVRELCPDEDPESMESEIRELMNEQSLGFDVQVEDSVFLMLEQAVVRHGSTFPAGPVLTPSGVSGVSP